MSQVRCSSTTAIGSAVAPMGTWSRSDTTSLLLSTAPLATRAAYRSPSEARSSMLSARSGATRARSSEHSFFFFQLANISGLKRAGPSSMIRA
ncbi:unnamed protein product, partial [Mycena citricolor]